MRKFTITAFIVLFCSFGIAAQNQAADVRHQAGSVLVKLKPEFAYMNSDGKGMRTAQWKELVSTLPITTATPLSKAGTVNTAKRKGAKGSAIDIRLYHQLFFDADVPVSEAIARLYKSGIVAMAEPAYLAKTTHTPNDPQFAQQYYLPLIKAPDGWNISKGSPEVIIAILDSGVDASHPDLAANIYKNEADPIDGIDNEGDGYIDNYWGWDFAGNDYQTLQPDNDPRVSLANASHGTMVSGCASAVTNNGLGIAGVGYNARLMILKHTADNDERNEGNGYLNNLLQGVLYAAMHGADIINASYGSTYYSQIAQDMYSYVAEEFDVLIVAAAGNETSAEPHFPSDFDYVFSVAATNQTDNKAGFSNFNHKVDISAPGERIYTTNIKGGYTTTNGTSFSAPLVSGAAALVKTLYPDFTGSQIGEVLRVTADPSFRSNLEAAHKDKMGRGRLDVNLALKKQGPSIRMDSSVIVGPNGDVTRPGNEALIYGKFTNFLWPTTAAKATLVSESPYITVVESSIDLGSMQMMQVIGNASKPFKIQVSNSVPFNTEVALRIEFSATNYVDYQYIKVLLNPTYFNVNENLIATSVAGNGRIGFQDNDQQQGVGFVFNNINMLYEMGVMMGVNKDSVVSAVRGEEPGVVKNDFNIIYQIRKDDPGAVSDVDVHGTFNDAGAAGPDRLNVMVDYRTFVWRESAYEKMVILEYQVKNKGKKALQNFFFGLYADWDINTTEGTEGNDRADWDAGTNTGYVYTPAATERWVAGIQVLSGTPNYWAIDNDDAIANNPLGVYDGFTEEEKYRSLSSGIGRKQAGQIGEGNDVSHTVSSGPYTIAAGDSITVAFALHGGATIEEVLASAAATELLYRTTLDISRPITGLERNEIPGLTVYPNPTRNLLNLSLPEQTSEETSIKILDLTGKQLYRAVYPRGQATIQLQMPQHPGLYVLEVNQGPKRSIRRIIVKP